MSISVTPGSLPPPQHWLADTLQMPQTLALTSALIATVVCALAMASAHQYSRRDTLRAIGLVPALAVAWLLAAYSLAFTYDTPWLGGLDKAGLQGWAGLFDATPGHGHERAPALSERSHVWFELLHALVAWGLALSAAVRRMSLPRAAMLSAAWVTLVYAPVAHWAWHPDGFLAHIGLVDASGALVVHLAGAASALAMFAVPQQQGLRPAAPRAATPAGVDARRLVMAACAGWLTLYAAWALATAADERKVIAAGVIAAIAAAAMARVLLGRRRQITVSGASLCALAAFAALGASVGHWPLLPALAAGGIIGLISGMAWAWVAHAVHVALGRAASQNGHEASPWMAAHLLGAVVGVLAAPLVYAALGQPMAVSAASAVSGMWQAAAGPVGIVTVLGYAWLVTLILGRLMALPLRRLAALSLPKGRTPATPDATRVATPGYSKPISAIDVHTPAATTKWSST